MISAVSQQSRFQFRTQTFDLLLVEAIQIPSLVLLSLAL